MSRKLAFIATVSLCALLYCGPVAAENSAGDEAVLKLAMKAPSEMKTGIGAYVGRDEDGHAVVSAVFENQPAKRAGLQEDDVVIEIDGVSTQDMTQDDLDAKLSKPVGMEAKLVVRRAGENDPLKFSIKRQQYSSGQVLHKAQYYEAAIELLKPLADKGVAEAQNSMGVFYEGGLGVAQDYKQAAEWYGKAAAQGYEAAAYNLGILQYEGRGMTPNHAEGKKNIEAAAEKKYADAEFWLAQKAEAAAKTAEAKEDALKWYIRAAEDEHQEAPDYAVKLMADKALAGKHDADMCFWLRVRGAAGYYWAPTDILKDYNTDKMQREAEQRLGPDGTKSCHQRVHDWATPSIREALPKAEKGDKDALNDVASFYTNRTMMQPSGPEFAQAEYEEGIKWQQKLAALGNPDDQRGMADYLSYGVQISINDPAGAHEWFLKAAAQNDPVAQEQLGREYAQGTASVDKDEAEAVKWYKKAAETGHNGLTDLATMYQNGRGTPVDLAEAYKWRVISQSQQARRGGCGISDDPDLKLLVSRMKPAQMEEGQKRAVAWLKDYVAKGNREGLQMLGRGYASDLFGAPDFKEAYFWLQLGAKSKPAYRTASDKKDLADAALHLSKEDMEAVTKKIADYKQPDWNKGAVKKNFGGTAESIDERARCMTETNQSCAFDACASGGDCKPGWKPVE